MKRMMTLFIAALTLTCAMAADLTGLKIYINPGHGGFDSNDRSIWTVNVPAVWTDSAGYWESKSNFVKGIYLRRMLQQAGATVIFSRERNDSGIRDIDEFKKKHPNATQHEIDSVMVGGDRDLSAIAEEANAYKVDHFLSIHSNALNGKTNYLLMLFRGENDKPQTAPSNEMAAMAGSVQIQNQLTTWTSSKPLIRGDLSFYGDGWGLGVLRPLTVPGHLSEGSFHDYAPETHRLMNNDYCHLEALRMFQYFHKWFQRDLPQTGTISGYVKSKNELVDVLNQPKFYYIPGSEDQWLPLNGALVKLMNKTGDVVLQTVRTDNWYNGIFAFYDVAPGDYKVQAELEPYKTVTMDVSVKAEEIATVKMHLQNLHMEVDDYPEPEQAGVVATDTYEFEPAGDKVETLPGTILRAVYRKGGVYVLTADNKVLRCTNSSLTVEATLPMPADVTLTDIAFSADDYLMGLSEQAVYAWDEDDLNPAKLYDAPAAWGKAFAVSGPLWKARLYVVNAAGNGFEAVQYTDGKSDIKLSQKAFASTLDLSGVRPVVAPAGAVCITVQGKTYEVGFDWTAGTLTQKQLSEDGAAGANYLRYARRLYMVQPVLTEGCKASFRLLDVTSGIDKAVVASAVFPENGLGDAPVTYQTAMAFVSGYEMHVYLLAEGEGYQHWRLLSTPVADIYAGEVSWGEKEISFRLNEDALDVVLAIEQDGGTADSKSLGALKKGYHTVPNPFEGKQMDAYSITATARPVAFPQLISNDDKQMQFYSAYGVTVDRTPSSPYFGRIYVTDRSGGLTSEGPGEHRTTTRGIYVLGSDFTDVTAQGSDAYSGNVDWGKNNGGKYETAPRKVSVGPDGTVYVVSSVLGTTNVYMMNPADPKADFQAVLGGKYAKDSQTKEFTGQLKKGKYVVANQVMDCYVMGKGEHMVLYTMDRNISLGTPCTGIAQYNIGELEALPWEQAPTATVYNDMTSGNLMQNGNGQIYPDGRGGWWMSQYRYDASVAVPPLIHINKDGERDFNLGTGIAACRQGAMAVTPDGNRLAIVISAGLTKVFDVNYDNGVPELTPAYDIQWGTSDDILFCMDFDAAGNLYMADNLKERLRVYSLPKLDNSYTTRISLHEETHNAVQTVPAAEGIRLWPNPAETEVRIVSASAVEQVLVYSLTGQLQMRLEATDVLNVSGLQRGVYVVEVHTAAGTGVERLLKK